MKRILFVCTVNVCRSAMAKGFFDQLWSQQPHPSVAATSDSAGTTTIDGYPAASGALQVMREFGLDLENHRSKVLTCDMVDVADVVLVMEQWHRHVILSEHPHAESKVHLLSEYAGRSGDVADPTDGEDSVRACAEELRSLVALVATRLQSDPA